MDFLQITSILIVLAAAFGAINYLFFKLPERNWYFGGVATCLRLGSL
jgi:hypothetical protein